MGVRTMKNTIGILIVLFVIAALTAVAVNAATYYVSSATPGAGNSCTSPDSNTIQGAIALASTGDTVYICDGTYAESPNVNKALTLQGQSHAAIVNGQITIIADGVTVTNLKITNPAGKEGIYAQDHSNLLITNNVIDSIGTTDATTSGTNFGIGIVSSSAAVGNVTISGNQISNVKGGDYKSADAIAVGWTGGAYDITNLVIHNNQISFVSSSTLAWNVGHGAYGILINHGTAGGQTIGAQVTDNTIDGLTGLWAHAIGLEGDTPNAVVTGNTIKNLVDYKTPSDAVGLQFEDNPNAGTVTVKDNNFDGIPVGVQDVVAGTTVNATQNWWGSVSGPSNDGSGSGAAINANVSGATVNYLQFLCAPAPTSLVSIGGTCLSDSGTINLLHYNQTASWNPNTLRVFGTAPTNAVYADIKVRKLDQSVYLDSGELPVGNTYGYSDRNYEHFFPSVSTWPAQQYQVVVFFYDSTHTLIQGDAVSAPFNDLFIEALSAQIDVLDAQVGNNTANITYLVGRVQDIWNNISLLNASVSDLESRLNAVELRLYGYLGNETTIWDIIGPYCTPNQSQCSLTNFCGDIGSQVNTDFLGQIPVGMLSSLSQILGSANEADVNLIWNACQAVKLNSMNTGTINLFHQFNATSNLLRVWGEAPQGATNAFICVKDLNSTVGGPETFGDCLYTYNATVSSPYLNENMYDHQWFDVSGWSPIQYNVLVYFFDGSGNYMTGYNVGQQFDDLAIAGLNQQVIVLQDDVANLTIAVDSNTGNITALWNDSTQQWDAIDALNATNQAQWQAIFHLWMENIWQWQAIGQLNYENDLQWHAIHRLQWSDRLQWHEIHMLDDRVTALEQYVKTIQGGLDVFWRNESTDTMAVKVYFPYNATGAELYAYDADGNLVYTYSANPVAPGANSEADVNWNVSDWGVATYTIKAHFLGTIDAYAWRATTFDGILTRWLEQQHLGFGFMGSQTLEVWHPAAPFSRWLTYSFTPQASGYYALSLVQVSSDNDETVAQPLQGERCEYYDAYQPYALSDPVSFPTTQGTYNVQLHAEACSDGDPVPSYDSNRFYLQVVDLAQPMPQNTAAFDELGIPQSNVTDIYWTNQSILNLSATLQSSVGWSTAFNCLLYSPKNPNVSSGSDASSWPMTNLSGNVSACSGWFNVQTLSGYAGDKPFGLKVCGEPSQHDLVNESLCDNVTVGYDNTPPVIDLASLNPGTLDAIRGVWNFSANVTDNGELQKVWFVLTNKTNASQTCGLGDATNVNGSQWMVSYPTNGSCTPDGYYNFTVYAQDWAGNVNTTTIDPIIDNTPPVVVPNTTAVAGSYGADGGFSVSAQVTDNLAGVANATAEFVPYTCNDDTEITCTATYQCENKNYDVEASSPTVDLSLVSCSAWSDATNTTCINGVWAANLSGTDLSQNMSYDVVIHATDKAGNANNGENVNSSLAGLYSQEGYLVTVNNANAVAGTAFTLAGSVVGTDGTIPPVSDNVTLSTGAVLPLLLTGDFQTSQTFASAGTYTVTASYTPDASCPTIVYTGAGTVHVVAAPIVRGGGGGGGGGSVCGPVWQCGSWSACSPSGTQTRTCTDKNSCGYDAGKPAVTQSCTYTAPAVTTGSGDTNTNAGSDTNTSAGSTQPAPTAPTAPTPTNGVTGAVTGGGFGSMAWFLVLLGLIVIALGGYFLLRKRK